MRSRTPRDGEREPEDGEPHFVASCASETPWNATHGSAAKKSPANVMTCPRGAAARNRRPLSSGPRCSGEPCTAATSESTAAVGREYGHDGGLMRCVTRREGAPGRCGPGFRVRASTAFAADQLNIHLEPPLRQRADHLRISEGLVFHVAKQHPMWGNDGLATARAVFVEFRDR